MTERDTGRGDVGGAVAPDLFLLEELLSDEERAVRDRVRAFGEEQVLPVINDYWERAEFPRELVKGIADLGVVGGTVQGHGCPGLSSVATGLVAAELARADGSVRDFAFVQDLSILTIDMLGSDEQRERWLPDLARVDKIGAFALTEFERGSDASNLQTRARRDGDGYVLDGAKHWITNGTIADLLVLWARDEEGKIGGFVVEPPLEGFERQRITGKTSCRAADHGDMTIDGVRVPAENRLANCASFRDTSKVLTRSRQGIAWECLGHALACYEIALAHALEREQFGRPLAAFQLVQDKLVRMAVGIETMQWLLWRLACLDERREVTQAMASAVKLHAASTARRIVLDARDILGGDGVLLARHIARHHVDVEASYTYEGTDTVNSLVVGRHITGHAAFTG
jgi:glutaryl-CoA dehydrogenase